jgi:hypothetical protein
MLKSSKVVKQVLFGLMLLVITSCKTNIKNKEDLITYINNPDNGLKKTDEIGKIKAVLLFKPWQLIAPKITSKILDNAIKKEYFFVLSLSANNKELLRQLEFTKYSEIVQVLAFRMIDYVEVTPDNKKSVAPEDCVFQQSYGMSFANQLFIILNKTDLQGAEKLKIKIREFGLDTGDLNFEIDTKDIDKLPVIAIE